MQQENKSRRKFLTTSARGVLVTTLAAGALSETLQSCSTSRTAYTFSDNFKTGFQQKPLPYAYNALENVIDATTMEIHYTKHAAGYAKNLADAAKAEGVAENVSVENILSNINKYSEKMRNNAGGHYNHEMFWQCMRPKQADNKPSGDLLAAIERNFTSFENFKTQFSDAGKNRFGSGWAWLVLSADKSLKIGSTPNQDNPLMPVSSIKGLPLLGLDVWEHAYYLKYQNKRPDYISNWWNVVNWEYVAARFKG
ncbi:superoxide dismutase [soil metagenome]